MFNYLDHPVKRAVLYLHSFLARDNTLGCLDHVATSLVPHLIADHSLKLCETLVDHGEATLNFTSIVGCSFFEYGDGNLTVLLEPLCFLGEEKLVRAPVNLNVPREVLESIVLAII